MPSYVLDYATVPLKVSILQIFSHKLIITSNKITNRKPTRRNGSRTMPPPGLKSNLCVV